MAELGSRDGMWAVGRRRYGIIEKKFEEPRSYLVKVKYQVYRRKRWHVVRALYVSKDQVRSLGNSTPLLHQGDGEREKFTESGDGEGHQEPETISDNDGVMRRKAESATGLVHYSPVRAKTALVWMKYYVWEIYGNLFSLKL